MTVRETRTQNAEQGAHGSAVAAADRRTGAIALFQCTLRQLEVFLAAAEDCHFVCTANRLGISQAAVSNHIATLERQFGKPLFVRKRGRRPALTSFGLTVLREARTLRSETARTRRAPARTEPPRHRTIHVGAGGHLLDDCIKQRLPEFCREHPDCPIECHYVDSPSECLQALKEGRIDVMVYTVANPSCFPLHAEVLGAVRPGLYVGGKLRARRRASPGEISALPFILPPEGSAACGMFRSAIRVAGVSCRRIAAHVQFAPVAKDLARQGEGVALLFDTMIGPEDAGDLIRLDVELPTLYRMLFRANGANDPDLRTVERFLREALAC